MPASGFRAGFVRPRSISRGPVQYDRVIYLLEDTPANRRWIHQYIDVWEYPDGRIEIRAEGTALPYVRYDRLSHIDQGAVVEHKRLGHALQIAQALQAQRDDRPAAHAPSRTNRGEAPNAKQRRAGTKKQREFTREDLNLTIERAPWHTASPPNPNERRKTNPRRGRSGPSP